MQPQYYSGMSAESQIPQQMMYMNPQMMHPMMHPMMPQQNTDQTQMPYPMYYMPVNANMVPGVRNDGDDGKPQQIMYMPVYMYPQQYNPAQGSAPQQPMFMPMMYNLPPQSNTQGDKGSKQ